MRTAMLTGLLAFAALATGSGCSWNQSEEAAGMATVRARPSQPRFIVPGELAAAATPRVGSGDALGQAIFDHSVALAKARQRQNERFAGAEDANHITE